MLLDRWTRVHSYIIPISQGLKELRDSEYGKETEGLKTFQVYLHKIESFSSLPPSSPVSESEINDTLTKLKENVNSNNRTEAIKDAEKLLEYLTSIRDSLD
jgi:hypothetical protein